MEKQPVISQQEFRQQFGERKAHYERLASNLQDALKTFLADEHIPYLEVLTRVKDVDSAYEKIARKEYDNPFEQIEDWCGLRIICYYPSDIDRICDMLKGKFIVKTQEDTSKRLAAHEFGYRSTHFILQIKPEWASTPNYRALEEFKAEVQVRTILMHAWAEIEHKLSYKSPGQVPEQFKRKLFRLSAKFEEADEQFEELRNGISEYRGRLTELVTAVSSFYNQELNLDTLQAFLNIAFPEAERDDSATREFLDDLIENQITMNDLILYYESGEKALPVIKNTYKDSFRQLFQVGCMRLFLDAVCDKYFLVRYAETAESNPWRTHMRSIRGQLGNLVPSDDV